MGRGIAGLFFDQMHEPAVVLEMAKDEDGRIRDWIIRDANRAALQTIGLKREEIIDSAVGPLFPDVSVDWITGKQEHARSDSQACQTEVSFRNRHYLLSFFLIDEISIGVILNDITERKQAEEELRALAEASARSEEIYRNMAEAITDPFGAYDTNMRLLYWNRASANLSMVMDSEAVGKSFAELFPNQVDKEIQQIFQRVLDTRQPLRSTVRLTRSADHRELFIDLSVYPTPNGFAVFAKDVTERARAEEELREAHEHAAWLARLPDENPNPVLRVGLDGTVLYKNRAGRQAAGWFTSAGEHLSAPLLALLEEVKALGAKLERDTQIGERQYFLTLVPFLDEGYINLYGVDISPRKRSEEALRKSEERFAKTFHSSPVAMGVTRLSDGRFIDVNTSHYKISGYTREEILGRTGMELGIYTNEAQRQELIGLLREHGSVRNYEMVVRRKTGELVTGLFSVEQIDLDGEPCLLTTGVDITERKQMEEALRKEREALRESQERERARANELEVMMDSVPAMIWIARDPECSEMIGNRQGYEFLRMGPDDNVSVTAPDYDRMAQPYRNMKNGVEIPSAEMPMQVAAATGAPARDYTFDLVFDDGTVCHLMGNVNPLLDAEGRPYGSVGAFIDITPIRLIQAQQVEAKAQIEVQHRLMEYREQERIGIARDLHDGPIQTLSSTAFNIQILKEAYNDDSLRVELSGVAQSVKNAVRELREIVNDLRPPSIIRFGLVSAIRMHAEDMQERHPEIDITLDLSEAQDHLSEQACLTLFRIFQEGLNNAIKHSGASKISVRYHHDRENFYLDLYDNGCGFDAQTDWADIASNGHFGLVGMRERALAVGAEFSVSSEPGQGTAVHVRGPLLGKNIK